MTKYEIAIKGVYGPLHKTINGYIWCGLEDITSSTIYIGGPRYSLYIYSLLERLSEEAPLKIDSVKIIDAKSSVISDNHAIPTADVQVEFTERHNQQVPIVYSLIHEGKVIIPFVIDVSALDIIKGIFPSIEYDIAPLFIAGKMF